MKHNLKRVANLYYNIYQKAKRLFKNKMFKLWIWYSNDDKANYYKAKPLSNQNFSTTYVLIYLFNVKTIVWRFVEFYDECFP